MNNTSKVILGVLVVVVAILSFKVFVPDAAIFGRQANGPIHSSTESFQQGFFAGTGQQFEITNTGTASTTGNWTVGGFLKYDRLQHGSRLVLDNALSTTTITAAQLCNMGVVAWTPGVAVASATLPSAASLIADCLPEVGSFFDVTWRNTAVAASTTAFTAGASTTLSYAFASSSSQGTMVPGQKAMQLRFQYVTSSVAHNMVQVYGTLFQ